jgi:hypothetical protein
MGKAPRYNLSELAANVVQQAAAPRPSKPYLAIDECLNHPVVNAMVPRLCCADLVSGAGPLWNQRRIREDGSIVYAMGGVPRGTKSDHFDLGKPEKHASWDDELVVHYLTCLLVPHDVVFLSENIRLDELGLRKLLRDCVAPSLDDRVSLTGLFRRGKTTYQLYCHGVTEFLMGYSRQPGYQEILL